MRLLVSALSCNPSLGSEALVGFKYAEALSRRYETVIIAAAPSQAPEGAALLTFNAGQCSFNEVSAGPLLRFELRQQRIARRLRNQFPFDYVHRITPSAIQEPTWAGRLGKPLIIGPLIAADAPPLAFARLLNRPVSPPKGPRWRPSRVAGRIYRTIVTRAEREQSYLHHARRILVGTRTALRQVPEHLREKCRLVTYSGVEHEVFVPPPARPVTNTVRLLFVGRLIPYKGVELLLRAVEIAARRCSIKLDIVGGADPVYKNFLLRLIQELRLESSVNFLCPGSAPSVAFSLSAGGRLLLPHPVRHLRDCAAGGDELRLRSPGQRRGGRGRNRERGERTQGSIGRPGRIYSGIRGKDRGACSKP